MRAALKPAGEGDPELGERLTSLLVTGTMEEHAAFEMTRMLIEHVNGHTMWSSTAWVEGMLAEGFLALQRILPYPAVHDDAVAFAEILPAVFRLLAEHDDIDIADLFLQVLCLAEPSIDRQSEAGDRDAVRGIA
jgi:hypothetical protein